VVQARNDDEHGDEDDVCVTVPSAVAGLTAASDDPTSVVIRWSSGAADVRKFTVNINETSGARCQRIIHIVCPVI